MITMNFLEITKTSSTSNIKLKSNEAMGISEIQSKMSWNGSPSLARFLMHAWFLHTPICMRESFTFKMMLKNSIPVSGRECLKEKCHHTFRTVLRIAALSVSQFRIRNFIQGLAALCGTQTKKNSNCSMFLVSGLIWIVVLTICF